VILLDEIGNMDKKILQEVIESIKKIENEGRLVLALLAKPGNEGITINSY
jgi:nucleoside-triphosphatase THEP1